MIDQSLFQQLKQITAEEQIILDGGHTINRQIFTNEQSPIIDSHKLLDKGKLIQVRTHTRFIHYPEHRHNYVELVYMCSGTTTHIINGDEVSLKEGELLFLNQNAVQEILPAGENDIAVNFIILPEFFDQPLEMISNEENILKDFIIGCLRSKDSPFGYLHFQVADILPIQNLMENLIWTITNNLANKRSVNQVTMGLLFLQLLNQTEKVHTGSSHPDQELILTVLKYIEEHYRDSNLTELAQTMHYDLYWLSREVKKHTGKTYTQLLQLKRLNQAAFLLRTTSLSIADIGLSVGYDNLSYFHRIFKERFGLSPKSYRNHHNDHL